MGFQYDLMIIRKWLTFLDHAVGLYETYCFT